MYSDGDSTTSLGRLFQCLASLSLTFVLICNLKLPWCSLVIVFLEKPFLCGSYFSGMHLKKLGQIRGLYEHTGMGEQAHFFQQCNRM